MWLSCLEDQILQSSEDVSGADPRVALGQALVRVTRQFGRARYRYCVLNAAVTRVVGRETDDLFTSLASTYVKSAASLHSSLAYAAGLPVVSFVRYKSSGGEMPTFQLWVRATEPATGSLVLPPFVLDYPRRGFAEPKHSPDSESLAPVERDSDAGTQVVPSGLETRDSGAVVPSPPRANDRWGADIPADAWLVPAFKAKLIRGCCSSVITATQVIWSVAFVLAMNQTGAFDVAIDTVVDIFQQRH